MPPRLYLETTIPSYLVARRSPLARIAADQQTTQDWWDFHWQEYEIFISEAVLEEISRGDARMAEQRRELVRTFPVLWRTVESEWIEQRLLRDGVIPPKAAQDAAHLALASVHRMDYLLTWNCTHQQCPSGARDRGCVPRLRFRLPETLHARRTHAHRSTV